MQFLFIIFSHRSQNDAEQTLNMTWPPSRDVADSDIHLLRHSFSETPRVYGQSMPDNFKTNTRRLDGVHSLANFSTFNPSGQSLQNTDPAGKTTVNSPSYHCRKEQPTQLDSCTPLHSNETRKHSPNSEEEAVDGRSDLRSAERKRISHDRFGTTPEYSPYSSQGNVHYGSDSRDADGERNEHLYSENTRVHSPYVDEEATYDSDKLSPKRSDYERKEYLNSKNTRQHPPYTGDELVRHKKAQLPKRDVKTDQSPEQRTRSADLGARKFNSMSSLADSSRMSTPLFQPRGPTRSSPHLTRGPHVPRYKRRTLSDGFDSGLGSEASRSLRLTTDLSDGVQKLNASNQLDSSLQLDLVSEMDENEPAYSPELTSTNYEPTAENGRQSPKMDTRSSKRNDDIIFINSSPSLPSTAERSPRAPAGYFTYRTSRDRLPSNGGHNTDDPSLSRDRPLLERRPSSGHASSVEETSRTHVDRRRTNRSGSTTPEVPADIRTSSHTMRPPARTSDHNSERYVSKF